MIYGQIATACGYTFAQIDEMTWREVFMLWDYWHYNPPTHIILLAAYGDQKKMPKRSSKHSSEKGTKADLARWTRPQRG